MVDLVKYSLAGDIHYLILDATFELRPLSLHLRHLSKVGILGHGMDVGVIPPIVPRESGKER